uniref:Uncharacterized protein n=1 Tax=Arundo donax TaxID=35708 RepID=A0A0A8Z8U3_ARUDO
MVRFIHWRKRTMRESSLVRPLVSSRLMGNKEMRSMRRSVL